MRSVQMRQLLFRYQRQAIFANTLLLGVGFSHVSVALTEMQAGPDGGSVTVFYPSFGETTTKSRLELHLDSAVVITPTLGNKRFVVISNASPGSP